MIFNIFKKWLCIKAKNKLKEILNLKKIKIDDLLI